MMCPSNRSPWRDQRSTMRSASRVVRRWSSRISARLVVGFVRDPTQVRLTVGVHSPVVGGEVGAAREQAGDAVDDWRVLHAGLRGRLHVAVDELLRRARPTATTGTPGRTACSRWCPSRTAPGRSAPTVSNSAADSSIVRRRVEVEHDVVGGEVEGCRGCRRRAGTRCPGRARSRGCWSASRCRRCSPRSDRCRPRCTRTPGWSHRRSRRRPTSNDVLRPSIVVTAPLDVSASMTSSTTPHSNDRSANASFTASDWSRSGPVSMTSGLGIGSTDPYVFAAALGSGGGSSWAEMSTGKARIPAATRAAGCQDRALHAGQCKRRPNYRSLSNRSAS